MCTEQQHALEAVLVQLCCHSQADDMLAGDSSVHKGEVLAYNAEKGHHLVFYDDGEDEWVDLSLQHVTWHEHVRGVTVAHGFPAGDIQQSP